MLELRLDWMRDEEGYDCVPVGEPALTGFKRTVLEGLGGDRYYVVRGISGKLVPFTIDKTNDKDLLTDFANIPFERAYRPSIPEKLLECAKKWGLLTNHHEMRLGDINRAIAKLQRLLDQDAATRLKTWDVGIQHFSQSKTLLTYCNAKLLLLTNDGKHIGRCIICNEFFIGERGDRRKYCKKAACRSMASRKGLSEKG